MKRVLVFALVVLVIAALVHPRGVWMESQEGYE